ncbi:MAG: hypothetical protein ACRCTJ_06775 [Brevinema sp.]
MKSKNPLFFLLILFISLSSLLFSQEEASPFSTAYENINLTPPRNSETYKPISSNPSGTRQYEELSSFTNKTSSKKQHRYYAGFKFGAQYGQFETLPYTDIIFTPYMQLGPFFLGYQIPLRFDWRNAFITSMWNSTSAAVSKIEMSLYYSNTNSIFRFIQAEITEKENIYQGHGRFFYDYNANQYAPYEIAKSFVFGLDISYLSMNYTIANIAAPSLMGAELAIKPMAWIKNNKYFFYKNFKIYGVFGLDLSPFHGHHLRLYDYNQADKSSTSPTFSMLEAGIDIPVFEIKNKFSLLAYGDFSYIFANSKDNLIINSASGISYGILMNIINYLPIRIEISHAIGSWAPRWVNKFYNLDRVYIPNTGCFKENKILSTIPNLTYYNASIGFDWKNKIFFNAEVFGDVVMNDLWTTLSLKLGKDLLQLFTVDFGVSIRGLGKGPLLIINQNSFVLELDLKYHMLPNMFWGLQWKYSGVIGNIFRAPETSKLSTKPFHFLGLNFSFQY